MAALPPLIGGRGLAMPDRRKQVVMEEGHLDSHSSDCRFAAIGHRPHAPCLCPNGKLNKSSTMFLLGLFLLGGAAAAAAAAARPLLCACMHGGGGEGCGQHAGRMSAAHWF